MITIKRYFTVLSRSRKSICSGNRASRVLMIAMGLSLGMHLAVFKVFSTTFMFNPVAVTELEFQPAPEPPARNIPRPRAMPKVISNAYTLKDNPTEVINTSTPPETIKPERVQASQLAPGSYGISTTDAASGIEIPLIAALPGSRPGRGGTSSLSGSPFAGNAGGFDNQSYYKMIRMAIERHKEYPDTARSRHIEGRVVIRFILKKDGHVQELRIAKSSRNTKLDQAALKAVQKAAPFPQPPVSLSNKDLPFEIAINFELS
ncbi:MAG: energy transducer TonB [Desulfobacteraceae bacterium]